MRSYAAMRLLALWLPLSMAGEHLARRVVSGSRDSALCKAARWGGQEPFDRRLRPVGELLDCCDALEGDCWPEHGNRSESGMAQ